jgi:uncharacterized protein involved in type VI secretion and phage assembly
VWDYCVQYQESSLDFISRLMELEGLPLCHEADKHTLVLTDAATQHQPFSGYEVIPSPDAVRRQYGRRGHQPVGAGGQRDAGDLQPRRL